VGLVGRVVLGDGYSAGRGSRLSRAYMRKLVLGGRGVRWRTDGRLVVCV